MASFNLRTKSKITVFADPVGQVPHCKETTTIRSSKPQKRVQSDNKENIDPFQRVFPKEQHRKTTVRSKNPAKTPVNTFRQSDSIPAHTPSPLADITEAHDGSYVSPLPLSVAYSVDGVKLRRSERVAIRTLRQQQINEMLDGGSPLSSKEEGAVKTKPLGYSSKTSHPQKRPNQSDIQARALKEPRTSSGFGNSSSKTYLRNTTAPSRITTTRSLRF